MAHRDPTEEGSQAATPGSSEHAPATGPAENQVGAEFGDAAPGDAAPETADAATVSAGSGPRTGSYERVTPASFEPERHYYTRVLNAQMHALVRFFMSLSNERIVRRYTHLHPAVDPTALTEILAYQPRVFRWAGSDLFHVTDEGGVRTMVVVETNSCPSGQKSMPLYEEHEEQGGYRVLLERSFAPLLRNRRMPAGDLAVLYDKNPMEASGYAAAMADLFGEHVHLVEFPDGADDPRARFDDGVLHVCDDAGVWHPVRCCFRYVTQRPWNRIPVLTKTAILNPVLACLAGGRNKMIAAKAYEFYNAEIADSGLRILTPETIWDVSRDEVPLWVARLGGHAVVKTPYSNAGQGVFTITSPEELDAFMDREHHYGRFIVQSLIGHWRWSSSGRDGKLFHVGTVPNKRIRTYVADLRVMVSAGLDGFRPLAIYARRARRPLLESLGEYTSWEMLGTNLSVRQDGGAWSSDTERLLLMDRKDFNTLGVGVDDLIDAYIQTVLSTVAIDWMATRLTSKKGGLKMRLFRSINADRALLDEVLLS